MNLHDIPPRRRITGPNETIPPPSGWINTFFRQPVLNNTFYAPRDTTTITAADLTFAYREMRRDPIVDGGRYVRDIISDIARIRDRLMVAGFRQNEVEGMLAVQVTRDQYRALQEYTQLEGDVRGPYWHRDSGTMRVMGMTVLLV